MRVIWKFPLTAKTEQLIAMPQGARVLTVHEQRDGICLWADCDPAKGSVQRKIGLLATGQGFACEGDYAYVGTAHLERDGLVFHVLDFGEKQ